MITKKDWDALPLSAKRQILAVVFGDDFEAHSQSKALLYEYRHNFDFDDTGKRLKKVLKQCYYTACSNTINVRVDVTFSLTDRTKFIPTPQPVKKVKQVPTHTVAPVQRKHWQIDYTAKDGDLCHVHCYADSKEEARDWARSEYWDIAEIIQIIPLRD